MSYKLFQDPETGPSGGLLQQIDNSTQLSGQYQLFGIFFGIGFFFMFISLFFIPSIPISPGKFSSVSAIGSLCMFFSLIFLKGVKSCIEGIFEGERKLYALAYVAALLMTFMASMFFRNYFASLLGAIAQVLFIDSFFDKTSQ